MTRRIGGGDKNDEQDDEQPRTGRTHFKHTRPLLFAFAVVLLGWWLSLP
jgi:hypothetical protein